MDRADRPLLLAARQLQLLLGQLLADLAAMLLLQAGQLGAGFAQGGALWFPDLTVADPYYILPVVTGGTFFAMASVDLMGTGGPVRARARERS